MPYLAVLNPGTIDSASHWLAGSNRLRKNLRYRIHVEWRWPSRCYRVLRPPPEFDNFEEVWCIFDGYPTPTGAPDSSDRMGTPGDGSAIGSQACAIQTWPPNGPDRPSCFTAVLVAPVEGVISTERDALGGRTAYWHRNDASFGVSTSSSLLARVMDIRCGENERYVSRFFLGGTDDPTQSAFQDIHQIPPGQRISFHERRLTTTAVPQQIIPQAISQKDPIGQFRETFYEAVATAIPGGCDDYAIMLSGGMDSGPVAAAASEAGRESPRPVVLSWKLSDFPGADEAQWIESIADFLGLEREIFEASTLLPFSTLDAGQTTSDYPIYNAFRPLVLETYRRAKAKGISTILNACGGDMIYPRKNWLLHDQIRRIDPLGAIRTGAGVFSADISKAQFARKNLRYCASQLASVIRGQRSPEPEWATTRTLEPRKQFRNGAGNIALPSPPPYAQQLFSAAHDTAYENAFSNRYGLDRRDPFQDRRLIDLMLQLPFSLTYRDDKEKWIMREAMRNRLPEQILRNRRTGVLTPFFEKGFLQNKDQIAELLLTGNRDWEAWVKRRYVENALAADHPALKAQLVIGKCIGYALWRESLRQIQERPYKGHDLSC